MPTDVEIAQAHTLEPITTIAARAGTIAYELLCGLTGRVHVRLLDHPPA